MTKSTILLVALTLVVSAFASSATATPLPKPNLKTYWALDGDGTDSAGGNDLSLYHAEGPEPDQDQAGSPANPSAVFQASSHLGGGGIANLEDGQHYLNAPPQGAVDLGGGDFTFSLHVNTGTNGKNQDALVYGTNAAGGGFVGIALRRAPDGVVAAMVGRDCGWCKSFDTEVGHTGEPRPFDKWIHFALVRDTNDGPNGKLTLYQDGVAVDSDDRAGINNSISFGGGFGTYLGTGFGNKTARQFDGKMNDVSIWDAALSQSQILYLKDNTAGAGIIPEPSTVLLLGLASLCGLLRRTR